MVGLVVLNFLLFGIKVEREVRVVVFFVGLKSRQRRVGNNGPKSLK